MTIRPLTTEEESILLNHCVEVSDTDYHDGASFLGKVTSVIVDVEPAEYEVECRECGERHDHISGEHIQKG